MSDRISTVLSDIVDLDVDAIVNSANSSLLAGGGVDGAIHDAAGPALQEACRELGGCPTGEARITPGFDLKARYVIHAVGPIWRGGVKDERSLLASCYRNSLAIASQRHLATVAFPSISTGAFGFPVQEAAQIATDTVESYLRGESAALSVVFCCFSAEHLAVYRRILRASASNTQLERTRL